MDPTGEDEAEASKVEGFPGVPAVAVKAAVGAWSGVMTIPSGKLPTLIGVPAEPEDNVIGLTVSSLSLAT